MSPNKLKAGKTILIAPNAFKGSLKAREICKIISTELSDTGIPLLSLPMGDGGDGTAEIIASYTNAHIITVKTCDALNRPNESVYYRYEDTALIELASICGLKTLNSEEYDVFNATTQGVGMAINDALGRGIRHILLCIGGSASIDGGTGALREMGMTFVNKRNIYQNHIIDLKDINIEYIQDRFKSIKFTILCDVDNPLCGITGAAPIFGPQKGASPEQVVSLNHFQEQYAGLLYNRTRIQVDHLQHGGAAGGIAAAFHALFNAELISGAEYCISLSGFRRLLPSTCLVITGEGKIDDQSLCGKIPGVIAGICRDNHIPVIAIAGSAEHLGIFNAIFQLVDYAPSLSDSISRPAEYLQYLCTDLKRNKLFPLFL